MASAELQVVLDILRDGDALAGDSFAEMRANMEAAMASMPLPDDVVFEPVEVGQVPAEWATASGARSDRVMIYFHGGGYCIGSIRTHRILVADLSRACGVRVLSVDYRLAPEHPHPAAVEDAVAAYRFVRGGGVAPSQVVFAGDSAGGGLTMAALIALREAGETLPGAAVGLSAWLDLTMTRPSMDTHVAFDPMLNRAKLEKYAQAYAGVDRRTATVSPLFGDLRGLPPLLLHVGSAETLLDDSVHFTERARAAGVAVDLSVFEDMIHVWHAFSFILPEARQAIDEIGRFVQRQLDRRS